ncbi:MAG: sulfatase-like hydrolase/transferase [Verrucomicrobia bacterium]|nr:sulfatase-like hydrolase/transferase [Verrucomicrobiota bacterium]
MKHALTLLAALLLTPLAALSAADTQGKKPNILLIIADDQGYADFGFMGNRLAKTPRLDRLAGESAVFRNFVVAAACSPTRAAIWTGRDHLLTGVWGVPPKANLRDDEVRMPAFFKTAGYRTFHVGKLDCVKAGPGGPSDFGWEEWTGGGGYEHRDPMIFQAGNNRRGQGWTVDIWTEEALRFIRGNRDAPWFTSVAYIIPHMPWVCDEKYSAPFLAQGFSTNLASCYGSIAHRDECIGRLLDGLRETGQEERTIVAFVSDNGMTSAEVQALATKDPQGWTDGFVPGEDWDKRNVARLRGHKATVWENGIRQPLLLRWPGTIAPGERKQFGCAEDVLPTLLDLAAVPETMQKHLPFTGVSLRPALRDAAETFERPAALRLDIAGVGAPRGAPGGRKFEKLHLALRGPRFKYHVLPGGKAALFDLEADPGETTDVQAKFPKVAAKMAAECRRRWDEILASGRTFTPPPAAPAATSTPFEAPFSIELIGDPHGQRGVKLKSVNPGPAGYSAREEGILRRQDQGAAPIWTLMQAYSKASIASVEPLTLPDGRKKWTNAYKDFILGHGTTDADFVLSVNSMEEYSNQYRRAKAPWPHLLLDQKICAPGGHVSEAGPSLADCESMTLRVGVRLRYATNLHERSRGYSEGIHAAQFLLYFTLQNLNRQSPGYGKDYVWFGVPFYDDRYPVISPSYMRDGTGQEDERKGEKLGTGRFINSVGTKPFAEHGLIPGEWLNIRAEVLPLMVEALERAWSRGFCNSSTNLADYKIGSMNIGWEVPGLSAVSAQIKDLSLLATGLKAEK